MALFIFTHILSVNKYRHIPFVTYYDGDTFIEKNLEENFNPATYKLFTEDSTVKSKKSNKG